MVLDLFVSSSEEKKVSMSPNPERWSVAGELNHPFQIKDLLKFGVVSYFSKTDQTKKSDQLK